MNYNKIFDEAFSSLAPITSNDEICSNVMERARKMSEKKRITVKKPFAIAAAAILTAAAATISVGAATGWDYFGVFGQIFGTKSENIKDNVLPEANVICDNIDDMNFEIVAAAADKHSVLTILDVYSENGFKLIEETEHGTIVHPVHDLHVYYDFESMESSGVGIHIIEQSEEKVRLGVIMTTESTIIKDEKLSIYAVRENKKDETPEHPEGWYAWSAEFIASFTGEEIRYEKELTLPCDYGSAKITDVEMSSISACVEGENLDRLFEEYHDYDDNYLVLDSGEKVMFPSCSSSSYISTDPKGSTFLILCFAEPVNPEEVISITIGDNTINLK